MKMLSRLLLVNWHNYQLEMIDFGTLNFLTGKNATGKSTIIDALQLVLLGDSSGSFFNKAASSRSSRTLQGYLFGEMGDDGAASFRYLRRGPFTSYVATLWYDTETGKSFTAGFMADCYADSSFKRHWFISLSSFDANTFLSNDDVPLSFNALKAKFTSSKVPFDFFDVNSAYQNELRARLGNINQKYMTLLRKAVPFSPITDIEKFITESICNIDTEIHIENMQNDIRTYTGLETESEIAEERLERLDGIQKQYSSWLELKDRERLHSYILSRSSLESTAKDIALLEKRLVEMEKKDFALEKEMAEAEKGIQELEHRLTNLIVEYRSNDEKRKSDELKARIGGLEREKGELVRRLESAVSMLVNIGSCLKRSLSDLQLNDDGLYSLASRLLAMDSERIFSFDFDEAVSLLSSLKERCDEEKLALRTVMKSLEEEKKSLEERLANLEKGIRPYARSTREALEALSSIGIEADLLCQEVEVADEEWRDSLEAILGTHRFDLIVSHEDWERARETILALEDGGDICLVDRSSIEDCEIGEEDLASALSSDDKVLLAYAASLLGGISMSEGKTVADTMARVHSTGLLHRYSADLYRSPFLGRRALEVQIAMTRSQLEELGSVLEEKRRREGILSSLPLRTIEESARNRAEEDIGNAKRIPAIEKELESLNAQLSSIDMFYLERLEKEIVQTEKEKADAAQRRDGILSEKSSLLTTMKTISDQQLPVLEKEREEKEAEIDSSFDKEWVKTVASVRYADIIREGKSEDELKAIYTQAQKATQTRAMNEFSALRSLREVYNRDYHAPFASDSEDNSEYQKERDELASVRLPQYREKIREAREAAYRQFREDFISKIKSRIEEVRQQIDDLNRSLRQFTFGRDRYRFEVGPNPDYRRYYEMFMDPLLMEIDGGNLFNESFYDKYRLEVDDLFDKLIFNDLEKASADRVAEYERNVARYTDYRTYLVFDLVVIDTVSGSEQRLSRTLLKKSGGETQLPFYIALLASFSQVCRIRQTRQNNTVRLVVFDEAFSKMDAERIRESIRLLGTFGLQAIFSAPSDKISDIAPLVDEIIVTYRDAKHSFTRLYQPGDLRVEEL